MMLMRISLSDQISCSVVTRPARAAPENSRMMILMIMMMMMVRTVLSSTDRKIKKKRQVTGIGNFLSGV